MQCVDILNPLLIIFQVHTKKPQGVQRSLSFPVHHSLSSLCMCMCTQRRWLAFFLSPYCYLYEFDWPFVYSNVTCLILWSAILEKCTENGQWPPVIFGSVYLQEQGPNLQRSLSSDPSQVYYSLSCLHTHSISMFTLHSSTTIL